MKLWCILINIIGGICVLGTYAYFLVNNQKSAAALWGGIPELWRPIYITGMILAACGYLVVSYIILFSLPTTYINYNYFSAAYALILIPSAFWMPMVFKFLNHESDFLWLCIRVILFLVALGALLIVINLIINKKLLTNIAYYTGLIGSIVFFIHVFVLDALVWPYFFRK